MFFNGSANINYGECYRGKNLHLKKVSKEYRAFISRL